MDLCREAAVLEGRLYTGHKPDENRIYLTREGLLTGEVLSELKNPIYKFSYYMWGLLWGHIGGYILIIVLIISLLKIISPIISFFIKLFTIIKLLRAYAR